jgi:glycosyltransferase involved in cell wall biosynthesis
MREKVSIIIPLHNNAAYIEEAINSCLHQTHRNIEIIVVENGSTDDSLAVVQQVKSDQLKIFSIGAASSAIARNFGFKQATGTYIQYLDADDLLSKNKIESQLNLISEYSKETLVTCPWGKFSRLSSEAVFKPDRVWQDYQQPIEWLIDSWSDGGMMQTACWLTHRTLIEKAGPWNEQLKQNPNDDGEFFCRVILNANQILFDSHSKVFYREPANTNVSTNRSRLAMESLLNSLHAYETEIFKMENTERVRRALAYNYARYIYELYPREKDLIERAQAYLKALKVHTPAVGGKNFKMLCKILGFQNALATRGLFS